MVIQRRIISPDKATMPEEDPDRLEDLGARPNKCPAPGPDGGEGGSMGPPPGKKPKKAKPVETPKPKKDPKPQRPKKGKKSKKTAELGEPGEKPQTGDPGEAPLIEEQDPEPGNAPLPMTIPRPGDTDPLEGETSPLRPEEEPTPLGTDPGQIDMRAIPLPPGLPPPPQPRQPTPPPEPQTPPKPLMPLGRATLPPTPGRRTPQEGETDPSPQREPEDPGHSPPGRQGGRNGDDSPSSSSDGENNGEGENSGDRENNGDGQTVATKGTVVMGTSQRAMATGATAKMETVTMMMMKTSQDTVTSEQAARHQAKGRMPPRKTRLLRPKNCQRRAPEGWGPQPPNHLPKVQTREKERSLVASFRESTQTRHSIRVLA